MTETIKSKVSEMKSDAVALYTMSLLGLGMMVTGLYEMMPSGSSAQTTAEATYTAGQTATGVYETAALSTQQAAPAVPIFGDVATTLLFLGGFGIVMLVAHVGSDN